MAHKVLDTLSVSAPINWCDIVTPQGTAGLAMYSGDPNGNVTAAPGSFCLDITPGFPWVKMTAGVNATGWQQLGQGGGILYEEYATKPELPTPLPTAKTIVKILSNQVLYWNLAGGAAWEIISMDTTGAGTDFDALQVRTQDLEIGQKFTEIASGICVMWDGTHFKEEGPK